MGSALQNDFSFIRLAPDIIFGTVGFMALMYGHKNRLWRKVVIGLALMAYPFFISQIVIVYLAGITLCAALYFWQE